MNYKMVFLDNNNNNNNNNKNNQLFDVTLK